MVEGCIFDLDGVIVDTAKYHYQAWKRLADKLDINFSEDQNEKMKGISRKASLDMLLSIGNITLPEEKKDQLCALKNSWYLEFVNQMDQSQILPGVMSFLSELKESSIPFALGSASKNARRILELLDITDLFDAIVDGNDVLKSKPDPEVFQKGVALISKTPNVTVVFEDSAKGIDAAITGGFRTVGLGHESSLGHADLVFQVMTEFNLETLNKALFSTQ